MTSALIDQITVSAVRNLGTDFSFSPSTLSLLSSGIASPTLTSGIVLPNLQNLQELAILAEMQAVSDVAEQSGGTEPSVTQQPIPLPPVPSGPSLDIGGAIIAAATGAVAGTVTRDPSGAVQTTQGGVTSTAEVPVTDRTRTTTTTRGGAPLPFGQFLELGLGALSNLAQAGVVRGAVGSAFTGQNFADQQPSGVLSRAEQSIGMNLPGGASCPQLFHVTKCGNVVANRVTFVDGHFFTPITPATWKGRLSVRGPRKRHTHAALHRHPTRRRSR